jgi:alkanesulfonate monooxygenase SsuD/methylene tetrahydromethanopterin reductase-like flavin-dependent oxidoreductase (luciferase family)
MRFSTFHIFSRPVGADVGTVLAEHLKEIDAAEALGFDGVWLTEHHGSDYGLCPSPNVVGAAVAGRTSRVKIGFGANISALHHPLRLSEEIALVDRISGGRVVAGFGSGYSPAEFSLYGVPFAQRHQRHTETLDIVRLAWRGEPFDYAGEEFCFDQARIAVTPQQQPHPSIAVAAASPEGIQWAGRQGFDLLVLGGVERVRQAVEQYRAAYGTGLVGAQQLFALDKDMARRATRLNLRWGNALRDPEGDPNPTEAVVDEYMENRVSIGAEAMRRRIVALEEAGVDEVLGWFRWGDMEHEAALETMRVFEHEVVSRP